MNIEEIRASIVRNFVNGWFSHSAAKSALKALGIPEADADFILKQAWLG